MERRLRDLALVRFALFDGETDGADDLDMYVYNGTSLVGVSAGNGSNESVTFTFGTPTALPISLTVVIHGYNTDGPDSRFKLFKWYVGSASAGNMTMSAPPLATIGATGNIGLSFSGLAPATRYLGSVNFTSSGASIGATPTIVSVSTP